MASHRAELLGRVLGAQFDLERLIGDAGQANPMAAEAENQLRVLSQLQQRIANAGSGALLSLSGEIAATVAQAKSVAQQGTAASASDASVDRVAKARHAIAGVAHDYYERKLLDPYLRFTAAEDEAAYRERERENREAYERESAKGSAEGARNARAIMERQLTDAADHGAAESPDYAPMRERLREAEAALTAPGQDSRSSAQGSSRGSEVASSNADADLDAVAAALKAAGVATVDDAIRKPAHGLTDAARHGRNETAETRGV